MSIGFRILMKTIGNSGGPAIFVRVCEKEVHFQWPPLEAVPYDCLRMRDLMSFLIYLGVYKLNRYRAFSFKPIVS